MEHQITFTPQQASQLEILLTQLGITFSPRLEYNGILFYRFGDHFITAIQLAYYDIPIQLCKRIQLKAGIFITTLIPIGSSFDNYFAWLYTFAKINSGAINLQALPPQQPQPLLILNATKAFYYEMLAWAAFSINKGSIDKITKQRRERLVFSDILILDCSMSDPKTKQPVEVPFAFDQIMFSTIAYKTQFKYNRTYPNKPPVHIALTYTTFEEFTFNLYQYIKTVSKNFTLVIK